MEVPFTFTVTATGRTAVEVFTSWGKIVKAKQRVLLNTGVEENVRTKVPDATAEETAQNFLVIFQMSFY